MREPEEMAWHAELGADGQPRTVHGIKRLMPEGSVEISEAEARGLSAELRANVSSSLSGAQTLSASPQFHVDLQPILDKLSAHAELLASHAATLDTHVEALTAAEQKIEDQSKDISRFKDNTAKAIAQMTEGIGEKGA